MLNFCVAFLALSFCIETSLAQTCTTDGTFADTASGCANFYICSYTGTAFAAKYTFSCPAGTIFDSNIKVCNYQSMVTCSSSGGTQPSGCTADGYFADTGSGCSNYYVCAYTGTQYAMKYTFSCPSGTLFDSTLNACNYEADVTCA
jgi:hypothetical protein